MANDHPFSLNSIERAMAILSAFDDRRELALADLARRAQLTEPTALRYTTSLATHGFLERDGDTGRYRLGLKLFELGQRSLRARDPRGVALPHMTRLRVQTRTVTAWTFARFAFVDPLRFAFGGQLAFQNRFVIAVRSRLQILVPNFAEPAALFTHPMRRIKGEQTRIEFLKCAAAVRAAHLGAHNGKATS